MRVSISLPCYGRPKRTIRSIENICNQTINGWEALVVGDGCPIMQDYLDSNYFSDLIYESKKMGNILDISNLTENKGGHGYYITNMNIERAKGKYLTFFANDDEILPNHLESYLSGIENTNYDFVYFDSFIEPYNGNRIAELRFGGIGHSELIIKTEFLKKMPPHTPEYGHDWHLIDSMMKLSEGGYSKSNNKPTYIVKALGDNRTDTID
jgi:glycosyltransferase involved in cell wall biosynthesis